MYLAIVFLLATTMSYGQAQWELESGIGWQALGAAPAALAPTADPQQPPSPPVTARFIPLSIS